MASLEQESCLSASVKHLICEAGVSSATYPECLNEKGLLNWNVAGSVMLEEEKDTPDYFIKSATTPSTNFNTIYKHFTDLDTDGFVRFMAVY